MAPEGICGFFIEYVQYNEYIEYVKTSEVYSRMEKELKEKTFSSKFIYMLDDREYLQKASRICGYPVYRCKHRWQPINICKLRGSSYGYKCKLIASRPQHLKETAIILSYNNNVQPWSLRLFEIMVQEIWYQYHSKPAYIENNVTKYVTRDDILDWAILYTFEAFKVSPATRNDILAAHSSTKFKLSFEAEDLYNRTCEVSTLMRMEVLEKDTKWKVLDWLYKKYPHYKWISKQYEEILKIKLDRRNAWEEWKKDRKIKSIK